MDLALSKKFWEKNSPMLNWLKSHIPPLLKDSEKELLWSKIKSPLGMNKAFCKMLLKTFH